MSRNHLRSQKISEVVPPIRIDSIVGLTLVDFYLVFVKGAGSAIGDPGSMGTKRDSASSCEKTLISEASHSLSLSRLRILSTSRFGTLR